jgi:hypothetical protein
MWKIRTNRRRRRRTKRRRRKEKNWTRMRGMLGMSRGMGVRAGVKGTH